MKETNNWRETLELVLETLCWDAETLWKPKGEIKKRRESPDRRPRAAGEGCKGC
jgi:hypothetical protein